jgi:hypothetical protein
VGHCSIPAGGVISGGKVTATQIEIGLSRAVSSDAKGSYVLVELPVGHYRLEVEAKGFQRYLQERISLDVPVFVPGQSTENNVDQRRLFSGCTLAQASPCNFASVGLIAGIANSHYHALETSLKKRFGHGLSFLASYTLSKTIDDVSSFNITGSAAQSVAGENDLAQNPFNLRAERGRSMFDARHRAVLSYEWSLPWWKEPQNWYQHILGNWQVNGITTFTSGTPFTVYDSQDVDLQGGAPEISRFSSNRPSLIGKPNSGPHTVEQWFNVGAFQRLDPVAQAGQFGNAGRNIVQGPGLQQ